MINPRTQKAIYELAVEKLQLAYVVVGPHGLIEDTSDNLSSFGFDGVEEGGLASEALDFMVGLELTEPLDMPMMQSPSGKTVALSFVPRDGKLVVLISDASVQAEQRQLLQQAANENELLLDRQKTLMTELEEASRLQTQFLSGVSHEFRTPLTSIQGYTDLVRRDLAREKMPTQDESKKNIQHLNAVTRSSRHLLSLVENLLDHGKLDSGEIVIQPKAVSLAEPFEDVELLLTPLSEAKNITLSMSYKFPAGLVTYIDDSRLRQCLINLLGNAIKFTDQGSVSLDARWQDNQLQVSIQDTGLGISEEDLNKICLPFWQAQNTGKAGTGLGLTITEKLIELMGGALTIESQLGVGTNAYFEMIVPQVDAGLESIDESADLAPEQGEPLTLKVLFAEDDPDIADLICMMLIEKGVDVQHVENGALAIERLNNERFDLVLMDINMPVLTGYQALEQMRKDGVQTPVVFMSASGLEDDRSKAEELGCDGYLVKPVAVDDIINLAKQLITK